MCKFAKLTDGELKEIRKLEEKLGRLYLLAVEKPLGIAELTEDQLVKVQSLERELGVRLVAYK